MKPLIIAHRGSSFDFPENTKASFDAACELKVDGIELDLQLTKDEQVVVFHDSFLDKAGKKGLKVCDLNWKELCQLDVGEWFSTKFTGQKILTLEDILNNYALQSTLLLEIKADEHDPRHHLITEKIVQCLEDRQLLDKVFILCFDHKVLHKALEMNPSIKAVYNRDFLDVNDPRLALRTNNISAISLNIDLITTAAIQWVKNAKKSLMLWTCNERFQVLKALDAKANYIMTDKPSSLLNNLPTKGSSQNN